MDLDDVLRSVNDPQAVALVGGQAAKVSGERLPGRNGS